MPATYENIATTTLSSGQATVTFSSIPSTFTDLILVANVYGRFGSTTTAAFNLRFNGDTASNYSNTLLSGNGSAAVSSRASNQTELQVGTIMAQNSTSSTVFPPMIVQIMNYANTTTNKTVLSRSSNIDGTDNTSRSTRAFVGLWRKTPEAINSIEIRTDALDFVSGSTFTLYGIKAA